VILNGPETRLNLGYFYSLVESECQAWFPTEEERCKTVQS